MIKFHNSLYVFCRQNRIFRICNTYFCFQHVVNTECCDICSRKHNRHRCDHQEGHDNLHCILDKCHNIANLHSSVIYRISTTINNQNGNTIHNKHHRWHHKCHTAVDKQVCLCQSFVGFLETFFLMFLPAECTDNRNTGKNFSCHKVQLIDQCL